MTETGTLEAGRAGGRHRAGAARERPPPRRCDPALRVRHVHRRGLTVRGQGLCPTPAGWPTPAPPSPPSATGSWWGRTSSRAGERVGFFGPLSVRPELWDQGDRQPPDGGHRRAVRPLGHGTRRPVHLCPQRQAPRALPEVRVLAPLPDPGDGQAGGTPGNSRPGPSATPSSRPAERVRALDACRELTATAYEGLDLEREIRAVESQNLGEVVLLDDCVGPGGHGRVSPGRRHRGRQPGVLRQVRVGQAGTRC